MKKYSFYLSLIFVLAFSFTSNAQKFGVSGFKCQAKKKVQNFDCASCPAGLTTMWLNGLEIIKPGEPNDFLQAPIFLTKGKKGVFYLVGNDGTTLGYKKPQGYSYDDINEIVCDCNEEVLTGIDLDTDPTNELQVITIDGTTVTLSNGGGSFEIPFSSFVDGENEFTHIGGDGTATVIQQATVVDNGDGTGTVTDSEGNEIAACLADCPELTDNGDGTATFTIDGVTWTSNLSSFTALFTEGTLLGTYIDEDGNETPIYVPEAEPSILTVESNGDGTSTLTHEAGGVNTEFCVIDKDLDPIFAVDFVEPESETCNGTFDLSEGGDTDCVFGQTSYTLTSIPDGYFAAVDAISGIVTFWKDNACGECDCVADVLTFEYDLVSQCGTESATHVQPINPPPMGELIVSKEMNFVDVPDGQTPTQIEIAICATNDPNATGNLVAVTLTDDLDPAFFANVSSTDPNITVAGNTVTLNATGINLAPGDQLCGVYIADAVFPNTHFPNVVTGEATDESGGTSTDSAPEVLPAIPVPEARLTWADVNGANGTVTASQSYVKTDGAPVADGEPFRFEVRLEDGTLWETITGTLNGGDYSSDRTDGLSITNFSPTGDFGNSLTFGFNKRDWANATGHIYAAEGNSALNGNNYISNIASLTDRTFAQELETCIYVGGQNSTTCPIESNNNDNCSNICKILRSYAQPVTTNHVIGETAVQSPTYTQIIPYNIDDMFIGGERLVQNGNVSFQFGSLTTYFYKDDVVGQNVYTSPLVLPPPYPNSQNYLHTFTATSLTGLKTIHEEIVEINSNNGNSSAIGDYSFRVIGLRNRSNSCNEACVRLELLGNFQAKSLDPTETFKHSITNTEGFAVIDATLNSWAENGPFYDFICTDSPKIITWTIEGESNDTLYNFKTIFEQEVNYWY